jgi:hypothetical protein
LAKERQFSVCRVPGLATCGYSKGWTARPCIELDHRGCHYRIMDAWGRVQPGFTANLVLFRADPLADIANTS